MKFKILLSVIAFCFCTTISVTAQSVTVTGKVTRDDGGQPLAGATIVATQSGKTSQTNAAGIYNIELPATGGTIVVSFAGMTPITRKVTASGTVNFSMQSSAENTLEDVIVVGYGTQKVTKISGSISTVKAEQIEKLKPVRVDDALQGQAAGVTVIQTGSPGGKPTVLVRGIPSFTGTDPTVIIDGSPQTLTDFNSINPLDIESVSVLKDAATMAIYGVKGGNGVIVVTTKSGRKNQKLQLNLSANYGIQEVIRNIPVLNGSEYAAIVNEGSTVAGGNPIFSDLSKIGVGTNWQDQVFKTAPMQSYTIGARGGSSNTTYFLSAGYLEQGGIVGGSDKSNFSRGNLTANFDIDLTSRFKVILNTSAVLLRSKGVAENSFNSVLGSAINFDPTVTVLNNNPNTVGTYGYSDLLLSEIFNPLTKLENTYNKNIGNKLYGKLELQYKVLDNLRLSSRFGYTKYDGNAKNFTPLVFYGPSNVENTMMADGSTVAGRNNSVSHEKSSNFNWTWETFGNYDFKVNGGHNFETTLGMSVARTSGNAAGATRQDVPFNSWEFADFTAATGANTTTNPNGVGGYYYQYFRRNASFFGRVNYDYKNRYLASFTARRDGSYAFGNDNKWANFFSGSAGWVVSRENFFQSDIINNLKIRGSYGTAGNENVSPQFVRIITGGPSYGPTANSNGYTFGGVFYPGSTVGSVANNTLTWETQTQANVGFDMNMFRNKLSISADYYRRDVSGLLFTTQLPGYLGTIPAPIANIGSTRSSGIDLSIGFNPKIGRDFTFNNTLTFTTVQNKVTATNEDGSARNPGGFYFNGQSQNVTFFEKGYSPGYFYGYKTSGLFQNQKEIDGAATQTGAKPGDIRYADLNNDGKINSEDQTQIGDPFADFTAGWNMTATYKNFDFTVFTYASVGNDIYRAYERNAVFSNKFRDVLNRWTGEGTTNDARYPRYTFQDDNSNIRVSDRYVEDGSFIKIKNVLLGYTLPKTVASKVFKSVRIYGQVRNAFVFTKYSGFDPEIAGGILDTGIDRGYYPQPRTFSLGLDFNFK